MKEFVDSFLNEANELVDKIEAALFTLEKNPGEEELIQEIFRGMHTIKGAAGMYGYDKTGELTHSLETIYDKIRDKELQLDVNIINYTFQAIDILRCFFNSEEKECVGNAEELNTNLKSLAGGEAEYETMLSQQKKSGNRHSLFYVFFTPDEKIFYRGINPLNIIGELQEFGFHLQKIQEGGVPLEKQVEENTCLAKWELYLVTDKKLEDFEDVFLFFDENEYAYGELNPEGLENDQAFIENFKKLEYDQVNFDFAEVRAFYKDSIKNIVPEEKEDVGESTEEKEEKKQVPIAEQMKLEKGIFVSSEKLDEMMNLVSELVTTNARLEMISENIKTTELTDVSEKIHRLSKQFRDNALSIRLVPIKILYQQFQRLVRELGNQLGKEIEFIAEGLDTELDKTIIKALESPLLHIIRNSIDHGIEPPAERLKNNKPEKGLLRFMSFYSGAQVVIQIHDDGAGINLDKVREKAIMRGFIEPEQKVTEKELLEMIIRPGFSTTENVSMVSGRGVGMDVVSKEVASVRGSLEINTEKGLGTIITLNIPVTLSILDTLLVTVDSYKFLIPVTDIVQCYTENEEELAKKEIKQVVFEEEKIPYINIRGLFGFETEPPNEHNVIVINKNNQRFAILVDKIIGDHQAVLKPLGRVFRNREYLSGASILGDGSLSYILDTSKLLYHTSKKYNVNQV